MPGIPGLNSGGALGALTVAVGVDLGQFNSAMDQVEARAGRATQTISTMGSSLSTGFGMGVGITAATAAIDLFTKSIGGAVESVVGLSSELEQAQIGFTAFTGSAQKAGDFVKQLQDFAAHTTFEFPSLLQASRQLMGMGVQAELVIPIMKDVGAAVMAVGGGDVAIKRVNLALTQMMAAGKVNAQDMNQLAQAGIPAWKMLADSMGMSIGQVRELSKQGQISASQLLQAFHNFVANNNLGTMLDNANKTWQAASSNMIDGLRNMATEGFSPLFAMARDGLVAIADELTSIDAKNFTQDLKATMQDLVTSMAPVSDAIAKAFDAFKTGGAGAAFTSILDSVHQLAQSMFGAGVDLVTEFASGIIQGASDTITAAANFVADIIASYLIGNSPPPVGPLSQIVAGGQAVIEAYVEGMKGGLSGVTDIAQGVADAFGNVTKTMTLTEGESAFKAAAGDVKALQASLQDVEGVVRDLDGQIKDNQNTLHDYQNAATDIKDAYEAAIEPLQKQVDALKEVNDLTTKQADLQDKISLARLKGQLSTAQGDPQKRAQLQTQLDELDQQSKAIQLQETGLRLQQQRADLADKAAGRKADPKDNTQTQQQLNSLAQQKLSIEQRQNQIQQEMLGMVDKQAVATIKTQQAQVTAAKDQRDLNAEIADLNRQLQIAPLEQQIKDLKAQEQALIAPIEERIKAAQREGQELTAQRAQWVGLKADITDALQAQKELITANTKASKEAALANPLDLTKIFKPEEIKAQATKVGESWLGGFKDYLAANAPTMIGGAIGGLVGGSIFGPIGAIAGAAFGVDFVKAIQEKIPNLSTILGDAFRTAVQAFKGDWKLPDPDLGEWVNSFVQQVGTISSRLGELFRQAQGGDITGAILGALGDVGAFAVKVAGWIGDAVAQIPWADVWSKAVDITATTATWFADWGAKAAGWIGEQVAAIPWTDVWNKAVDVTATAAMWFGDFATRAAGWIGEQVAAIPWTDVWNKAVDVTATAVMWFGDFATRAAGWIGDQVAAIPWADVWSKATDILTSLGTMFTDLGTQLTTWITNAVTSVKWDEVWKDSSETAVTFWSGSTTVASRFQDWITGQLSAVSWLDVFTAQFTGIDWSTIFTTSLTSLTEGIRKVTAALTTGLLDSIKSIPAEDIGKALVDVLGTAWVTVREALAQGIMGIWVTLRESLASGIVGAIQGGIAEVPYAIMRVIAGLIVGIAEEIWKNIQPTITKIMDLVVGTFNNFGTQISAGVAKGISDSSQEAQTAARDDLAKGISDSFSSALGIQSPSTVFQDFGAQIDAGLVLGITEHSVEVVASLQLMLDTMMTTSAAGWTAISDQTTTQLDDIYTMISGKFTDIAGLMPIMMAQLLADSTAGWSAIHSGMTTQLDEIWALINQKTVDMTGAITNMMAAMLAVIMGEQEKWSAAGTALGNAFAASALKSMSSASSGGMMMMSSVTGGSKASPELQSAINSAASRHGLDPALFTAQLQHESAGFDPNVLTGARRGGLGEVGIGQFLPSTLKSLGVDMDKYLSDVNLQIETSAKYLSDLVTQYGDIDKALQAYNGGAGGVGTAATQNYVNIIHSIAAQLTTSKNGNGTTMMNMAAGGGFASISGLKTTQMTAGAQAGLSPQAAAAACGPYAAVLFSQAVGRMPNLAEATQLAATVGWTPDRGMAGTDSEMALLSKMGLNAVKQAATPMNVNAATAAGNPLAISTPKHYFVAQGGTAEGGLNVGSTGTVMGGKPVMTLEEIRALGGGINDIVVLLGTLDKAGQQTFQSLTQTASQMGPSLNEDKAAQDALATSTQTLAQSIAGGLTPAGLAARDAVGQMSIGIQPLISQFANGQITSDQLGQSIVQLASDTGLATQPLEQLAAGNVSVDAALQQVLTSLAQADPAFAQINTQFNETQQSSGALANTLLQGLGNVTGTLPASLQQIAASAKPLEESFAAGAISGDQFVQSVVQLAATSGLTQEPLRAMQDGMITTNEALAQVVTQVAAVDPAMADMATSIADTTQPATDAAAAFLDWSQSMVATQQATDDANQVIQQVPAAVADIEQPVQDAAQTSMQPIPDAATTALNDTVSAINGKTGDFQSAGQALGQALVDGISNTVKEAAQKIADDVSSIVKDALDAAKKAADAATANLKSKTKGGSSSKKSSSGGDGGSGDNVEGKAVGGRITPGIWTLVGEEGPELISPNGYVYTAAETLGMISEGMASGLVTLEHFASGGSSKSKSSSSKSKSKSSSSKNKSKSTPDPTPAAPKKQQTEPYAEEVGLQQQILGIEQQRDKLLVEMGPLNEKIRKEEEALKNAQAGSVESQLQTIANKKASLEIDSKIYHLEYDSDNMHTSTHDIELKIRDTKTAQEKASKGDLGTQLKLNALEVGKLRNNALIAQIQADALPLRQKVAGVEAQIADIQKGSLADQLTSASLSAQKNQNLLAENQLQIKSAPLRAEVAKQQKLVNTLLEGTVAQKQTIASNDYQIAVYNKQELEAQKLMVPVQSAIRDLQKEIDSIQNGSIDQQKEAIDLGTKQAQLRLQEIDAQGQLRDVEAGTLSLSQQQINDLNKRLEVINAQKADLSDQSETQQLMGQIASADDRKHLIDLNAQQSTYQNTLDTMGDQRNELQNQNDLIKAGNAVDAAGAQAKLADLQTQLDVYDSQITQIEAQNSVLDLQLQGIQLQNQIRSDGLQAELITLNDQLGVYDKQVTKIQEQNDTLTAQAAIITANNAVAAASYNSQLIIMQEILDARQAEITKLNDQKTILEAQTGEITTQNNIAAAGHQAQLVLLNSQEAAQQTILSDLNAQIGSLNAQKKIYQDIRDLADYIANRPVSPTPAPVTVGGGTGTGGPPGAVVATATKDGAPTLYLSRGTGIDGWYTSSGQMIAQGGSANPPSGYKIKWLADGGLLKKGEIAIVGERGPEPIVAQQDLVVFPNETLSGGFGRGIGNLLDGTGTGNNINVSVEYHRHGGTDYGEATLTQVVREAIDIALRQ